MTRNHLEGKEHKIIRMMLAPLEKSGPNGGIMLKYWLDWLLDLVPVIYTLHCIYST